MSGKCHLLPVSGRKVQTLCSLASPYLSCQGKHSTVRHRVELFTHTEKSKINFSCGYRTLKASEPFLAADTGQGPCRTPSVPENEGLHPLPAGRKYSAGTGQVLCDTHSSRTKEYILRLTQGNIPTQNDMLSTQ